MAYATRAVGVPAIVPRGDVPLVGYVDQDAGEELQGVGCLGARGRALRFIGAVRHRLGGPVVGQPLKRDGIPGLVPRERARYGAIAVGPEPAVGDEEMQVRMPVRTRAMRRQTRDDADRQIALAGERADRGGHGARGHARDLAEQAPAIRQYARSRFGIVSTTCPTTGRHGPYSRAKRSSYTVCNRCR